MYSTGKQICGRQQLPTPSCLAPPSPLPPLKCSAMWVRQPTWLQARWSGSPASPSLVPSGGASSLHCQLLRGVSSQILEAPGRGEGGPRGVEFGAEEGAALGIREVHLERCYLRCFGDQAGPRPVCRGPGALPGTLYRLSCLNTNKQ